MNLERIKELRERQNLPNLVVHGILGECLDEIERLRAEGSPGVMHEIDRGFYELTVTERNYERLRVDRLEKERQDLLESAVLCEDAEDIVLGLIEEAKKQGITKDGHTLV